MTTIAIDDSGSPGSKVESKFLTSSRNTWVGVLVVADQLSKLNSDLTYFNKQIKEGLNINELHFADLVNGNNEFSGLDQERRLELLYIFCLFYKEYQFPFFIQTTNPETLAENGLIIKARKILYGGLDFTSHKCQGLLLLLIKIKKYIEDQNLSRDTVDFVIDEGLKKKGSKLTLPILSKIRSDCQLRFESSKNEQILQIADFVAYGINRIQTTMVKDPKERTDFDKVVLHLISDALGNKGISGVTYLNGNYHTMTKDDYDYEQITQRQIDRNLDKYRFYHRHKKDL